MQRENHLTRRNLLAATGITGLSVAGLASAAAADEPKEKTLSMAEVEAIMKQCKESQSCRLLPRVVDETKATAKVVPGIVNNTFILIVAGKKPFLNMEVKLSPVTYVRQPDYWEIEVIGCVSGIVLPTIGVYHETLPLDAYRGKKGIEVVWADDRYKIDLPSAGAR